MQWMSSLTCHQYQMLDLRHLLWMNNSVTTSHARKRLQDYKASVMSVNRKLKDIIKSGTFDELAFEKVDEKVNAMTGIPTYSKLQVVLTFVLPFLQTGTNLSPVQQLLLTLMRLKMNLPLSLLGLRSQFQLQAEHLEAPLTC